MENICNDAQAGEDGHLDAEDWKNRVRTIESEVTEHDNNAELFAR